VSGSCKRRSFSPVGENSAPQITWLELRGHFEAGKERGREKLDERDGRKHLLPRNKLLVMALVQGRLQEYLQCRPTYTDADSIKNLLGQNEVLWGFPLYIRRARRKAMHEDDLMNGKGTCIYISFMWKIDTTVVVVIISCHTELCKKNECDLSSCINMGNYVVHGLFRLLSENTYRTELEVFSRLL